MNIDNVIAKLEESALELEAWAASPANYNHPISNDLDCIGWELLRNASSLREIVNHFGTK